MDGSVVRKPSPGDKWSGEGSNEYTLVMDEEKGVLVALETPLRTTELQPREHHQIYRGETERDGKKITETITIDTVSPDTVYRYTEEAYLDGPVISVSLSLQVIPPYPSMIPFL